MVTDWMTGRSWLDTRQRQRIFPLTSESRLALRHTQSPVQWVLVVFSLDVNHGWGVTLTTHPHLVLRS
jgi:hypothetical protein